MNTILETNASRVELLVGLYYLHKLLVVISDFCKRPKDQSHLNHKLQEAFKSSECSFPFEIKPQLSLQFKVFNSPSSHL